MICLYFYPITRLYLFLRYNYIFNIKLQSLSAHAQLELFVVFGGFINVQVELYFPSALSRALSVLIG